MAIIYKIFNTKNNKMYIGSSQNTLEERMYSRPYGHLYLTYNKNFRGEYSTMNLHKAIREYGKESFIWDILEEKSNDSFSSKEELVNWLDEKEQYYISLYDTINNGYNETSGGRKNYKRSNSNKNKTSIATKKAMSKLNTKELCNPTKNMTEEQKSLYYQRIVTSRKLNGYVSGTKGKICVNNGKNNKYIKKEDLDKYLKEGYKKGSIERRSNESV